MAEHAKHFGPSGADTWSRCSGSPWMIDLLPESGQKGGGYAADEGTAAHELLAWCQNSALDPEDYPHSQLIVNNTGFDVTEEMCSAVRVALRYTKEVLAEHEKGACQIWVETKVNPGEVYGSDDCWGTSDIIIATKKALYVIDFKYGKGHMVEAQDNRQVLNYAIGAAKKSQKTYDKYYGVIVQPRRFDGKDAIQVVEYSQADIDRWAGVFTEAIKRATKGPFELSPSEEACLWCKAKGACSAHAEFAMKKAQLHFASLPDSGEEIFQTISTKAADKDGIKLMSLDQIKGLLSSVSLIRGFVSAVEDHALAIWESGKGDDSWKIVEGRSNRKFSDPEAAKKKLKSTFKMKQAEYLDFKLKSPKGIETFLTAQDTLEMTDRRWNLFRDLIVKPPGKHTLAPALDIRPNIRKSPEEVFQDETGPDGIAAQLAQQQQDPDPQFLID